MRVTVYRNIAAGASGRHPGYRGYEPGHPLAPVFAYTISPDAGSTAEQAADFAYAALNADPDMLTGVSSLCGT